MNMVVEIPVQMGEGRGDKIEYQKSYVINLCYSNLCANELVS